MDKNQDNIRFIITNTTSEMDKQGAEVIAGQIRKKPDANLGLATGGTPVGTYGELVKLYKTGDLDFSRIQTFNLDEYFPILKTDPNSYDAFMKNSLFNHIKISPSQYHLPNGEAADPHQECAQYEASIFNAGGIDLQLLGIGNNGHIGFNEPADFFTAATHYVALDERTIEANARFFASPKEVPRHALTMGIKTIMMAKRILLLASGKGKANIIKEAFLGPITPKVPASVLQLHQDVTVVVDQEAGSQIINLI